MGGEKKIDVRGIWRVKSEWFVEGLDMGEVRFYRLNWDERF